MLLALVQLRGLGRGEVMAKPRGRPSTYNKAKHEDICRNLTAGMSRTTAAELAGIDRSTLEAWRDKYPAFSRDVTEAIAKAKRRASFTIAKAIDNGDVNAAFRYLALQERDEWQERQKHEHAVTVRHEDLIQEVATKFGITPADLIAALETGGE